MSRLDYLVTGANGQLGRSVHKLAAARGRTAVAASHAELAVEDRDAVRAWVDRHRPRFVLHCGAWTNVDGCEADPVQADRCNGHGTGHLALACAAADCGLLYVSTDFVFDGTATAPYRVDAPTAPLSAYGRSKLLGEQMVLQHRRPGFHVLRTSWVFGPGGKNFPKAILDRARSGNPVAVVTDQRGRPTYTPDLAEAMLDLCESGAPGGVWHAANEGECSWHQFAAEILRAAGLGQLPVGEITAAKLARPAARPAYSVLDTQALDRLRGRQFPHYRSAIERWLAAEAAAVS
jgi:dTDP-4-dehydrorhamnose reductase